MIPVIEKIGRSCSRSKGGWEVPPVTLSRIAEVADTSEDTPGDLGCSACLCEAAVLLIKCPNILVGLQVHLPQAAVREELLTGGNGPPVYLRPEIRRNVCDHRRIGPAQEFPIMILYQILLQEA